MSALSLSRYLPDFSTHHIEDEAVEIIAAPLPQKPLKEAPVAQTGSDAPKRPATVEKAAAVEQAEVAAIIAVEEEKRVAFEAGREDGHREAQALYEAERARLVREHETEIETLRATFSREQALLLAGSLTDALTALERNFSAQIAEILMPLLAEKMEREAVAEFARRIAALALDGEAPEISGPARLIVPLRDHAALLPSGCRFSETGADELSFSFGDRMLETRIAPLLEELKAAVQ
ncbi:hypothetical protein HGG72_17740 [Ochrobactrum pecoris]|uniref:Uncharacterized protein n=1 Tax=Brucella pecoris TaxID=867683 RepID=A0A5C5CGZ3_9HYPH|nr:hypothetical protein [Brucella pecoris]MBB4095101.1 hypothetical protein [Brucella pecoris]NKW81738.1 hypothetical protein [Brucella pecoris]TNV10667.1 hypothetical protein FIB18_17040 [Brucella pecoris]